MASYTISTAVTAATGPAQTINTGDTVTVLSSGSLNATTGAGIYVAASAGLTGGFDIIHVNGTVRGATYGFDDGTAGGNDSIHVAESGHIFGGYGQTGVEEGSSAGAAIYIAGGSNTITNNGNIIDNAGGSAINIESGGNSVTNAGTISASEATAIYIYGGSNTINNSGIVSAGSGTAIELESGASGSGHNAVTNSGTVTAQGDGIFADGNSNSVINSGTISVAGGNSEISGISVSGNGSIVTNTGTISVLSSTDYGSGVVLFGKSNTLVNSGTIKALNSGEGFSTGVYSVGTGNVIHNNAGGLISGGTFGILFGTFGEDGLFSDSVTITNAGQITGGVTGIDLDTGGTGDHIKVKLGGSVTGTEGIGIAVGNDTEGGPPQNVAPSFANGPLLQKGGTLAGTHIVDKGSISGGEAGIAFEYGSNVVKVGAHGTVTGGVVGIFDLQGNTDTFEGPTSGGDHIFNAGTIQAGGYSGDFFEFGSSAAAIFLAGGSNRIHNTGNIIGGSSGAGIFSFTGNDHVTNSGHISGLYSVVLDGNSAFEGGEGGATGHNILTNLSGGVIQASATTDNSAVAVFLGGSGNMVTNSGKIFVAVHDITNNAAISTWHGSSNTVVNNAGGLISDYHAFDTGNYAILMDEGGNIVTNAGEIVGTVQLGNNLAADVYDGSAGRLKGTVFGGNGADTITLGAGHSSVVGERGGDNITVGTGADNLIYKSPGDSDITAYDTVDGFKAGTDHFSFALSGPFTGLVSVTVNSLSAVSDSALGAAVTGHLDPYGAVALSVSTGVYSGDVFLIVDANGDSKFDAGAAGDDYLVVLTHLSGTLSASDIQTTMLPP